MAEYDFLVVGCGMFGAVFAQQMFERGKKILVIEKRRHIGGNCYTEDIQGIQVHKYGPHIFHTSDESVWQYVNRFSEFNHFVNRPKVMYRDRLYSFPINLMTLHQLWGVTSPAQARRKLEEVTIPNGNPQNLEEWILSQVGREIYEIFVKGYTTKQWGKTPRELPVSIMRRIPIRLNLDDNYYNERHQGIPIGGYTKMFGRILEGIEIRLNTDFFDNREYWRSVADRIVYTGKIDRYFDYRFGELEYRGLRFETKVLHGDYQGNAVVNYTEQHVPFTRITEHKHFEFQAIDETIVTWEYPEDYDKTKIPYYPINDDRNNKLYGLYKTEADKQPGLIPGGRLATYAYLDMGQTISSAMNMCKSRVS